MRPTTDENEGYVDVLATSDDPRVTIDQPLVRNPTACPFQGPCWKFIRSQIAKRGFRDEDGVLHKMFVPYICSFQLEGDLENCGHLDKFESGEYDHYLNSKKEERDMNDGSLPT